MIEFENIDILRFRLVNYSNKDLLDNFIKTFDRVGYHNPENKIETDYLLMVSKLYVEEFWGRLENFSKNNDFQTIVELAKMIQLKLKSNKLEIMHQLTPFAVRNMIRLYALCHRYLRPLQSKNIKRDLL